MIDAGCGFGILAEVNAPRFSEMNKVRVTGKTAEPYAGYVSASQFKDGRWIYKLSITDEDRPGETYDNWVPEEWCELTK